VPEKGLMLFSAGQPKFELMPLLWIV